MSSPDALAEGFSITGLLDGGARTRRRFPVEEVPPADIAEHPANADYSMDPESVRALADSIAREGLTDLPLVRRLTDGSLQMISGHRRRAAWMLLAEEDDAYARMPCRVAEGIDDDRALVLLHAANYFTRSLTVTERAAASRALGREVERMRGADPSLAGARTEDIKAAIISEHTGRKVSGRTVLRQEALADAIGSLSSGWRRLADEGALSAEAVAALSGMDERAQQALHVKWAAAPRGKRETTEMVRRAAGGAPEPDPRLRRADAELLRFLRRRPDPLTDLDRSMIEAIARHAEKLRGLL